MIRHRIMVKIFCLVALTWGVASMASAAEASASKTQVVELNENDWRLMLQNEWMVEFYAPWCPACKNLSPTWDEFSTWSDDLNIKTAKIDVTNSPSLSGRFFVTALPTIFHVLNGEFRQYKGARDLNSLMSFVEEKKWQSLEPISSWKSPDSIQMAIVSWFFKLSHYLKEINTRLLQDYGLPPWGSYAIFAVATIFLGAVLGLILVCCIDFLYPPKNVQRQSFSESREKINEDCIEELSGDELEDEEEEAEDENKTEEDENKSDEDGEEDASTSEGEKNSESDSESPESDKKQNSTIVAADNEDDNDEKQENGNEKIDEEKQEKPSPEVRKRRPRKAD